MKRVKVRLVGTGTELDPYRVNLPTYMLDVKRDPEGKPILVDELPEPAVDYEARTAWVLVPDDEVDPNGRLNEKRIREKYREHWANFRREEVEVLE